MRVTIAYACIFTLCMHLLLYQQLYKGAGEDVIQLFDLSTMPKGRSSEDHHSACPSLPSLINKGRRETLFSLGTLLYRVAHRLSLSKVYIFFGTTIWLQKFQAKYGREYVYFVLEKDLDSVTEEYIHIQPGFYCVWKYHRAFVAVAIIDDLFYVVCKDQAIIEAKLVP